MKERLWNSQQLLWINLRLLDQLSQSNYPRLLQNQLIVIQKMLNLLQRLKNLYKKHQSQQILLKEMQNNQQLKNLVNQPQQLLNQQHKNQKMQ